MQVICAVVALLVVAGCAGGRSEAPPDPQAASASVPPVEYRSAFEGYRRFADQELADWRRANEEVGAAGGHKGHAPGQGTGQQTSKPQPGKPESSGGPAEHGGHR
jgi:hypothetical protein